MNGHRFYTLLGAAIAAVFFSSNVLAAPDTFRVGYVDLQQALTLSSAGAQAQQQYEKEVKKAQGSLDSKKANFDKMQEEFIRQRDSLSADARTQREEKLRKTEKELRRTFEDTQDKLRRENARLVSALVKELRKVVDDVGKKEGFTFILEKGAPAVLYTDNSIDITATVVKEFNKRKPTL